VVKLRYTPDGASTSVNLQRSFLVGKGVAMDTGGVNLKGNGGGGMSRDKGGAAAVAGFMLSVATLKPKDHSFTAFLCMVRNSIGSNAYVPDEIIKTRAGTRVLVVNTDAEGRFSMADSLCEAKEMALSLPVAASPPQLWTVATLTGHAVNAYGSGYSAVVANGPARLAGLDVSLEVSGDSVGDPVEVSRLRREDYDFIGDETAPSEDIRQNGSGGSAGTARGHQFPAAFLIRASGLDRHDIGAESPLCFRHLDIAGSGLRGRPHAPTGRPIAALLKETGILGEW
jgi:leucyl aminopeptidase